MSSSARLASSPTRSTVERAAPLIEVPYLPTGSDLAGWDCRGCVRYVRREIFGLPSPGMESAAYSAAEAQSVADVERLMLAQLDAWRSVDIAPGVVLLLRLYGRDAHVGCYLGGGDFIHSLAGQGTSIVRLADWTRRNRLRGAYEIA